MPIVGEFIRAFVADVVRRGEELNVAAIAQAVRTEFPEQSKEALIERIEKIVSSLKQS